MRSHFLTPDTQPPNTCNRLKPWCGNAAWQCTGIVLISDAKASRSPTWSRSRILRPSAVCHLMDSSLQQVNRL